MKALIWTLLLVICTHVLVLDAVHHEHDGSLTIEQSQSLDTAFDVLDRGGEHCCQCHGFMATPSCSPARTPAPAQQLALSPIALLEPPLGTPFRPPIV